MATKKTTTKTAEVKEEVKAVEAAPAAEAPKKETAAKKTPAKKTAVKKEAAKKTPAKKEAAKAEAQVNLFIQFNGTEVSYNDLIEKAKADAGVKSPKTVNIYVKPEDNMVYYVVNEKDGGFALA